MESITFCQFQDSDPGLASDCLSIQYKFYHLALLTLCDGVEFARLIAGTALDTAFLIDQMRLFYGSRNAIYRALTRTSRATDTLFRDYLIAQQVVTHACRALLINDMSNISS
jgi:hypothetical protein